MVYVHQKYILYQWFHFQDQKGFKKYTRTSPDVFDILVRKVTPLMETDSTSGRPVTIRPEEKLSTTLRFLASGRLCFLLSLSMAWIFIFNYFILFTLWCIIMGLNFWNYRAYSFFLELFYLIWSLIIDPLMNINIEIKYCTNFIGDDYTSLEFLTRIPNSSLSTIIPDTCRAIIDALQPEYIKVQHCFVHKKKSFYSQYRSVIHTASAAELV